MAYLLTTPPWGRNHTSEFILSTDLEKRMNAHISRWATLTTMVTWTTLRCKRAIQGRLVRTQWPYSGTLVRQADLA